MLVFHVLDDDELTFPFAGTTRFEGMEELPHLLCDPRALRDGYLEALEEYLVEVRRGCTRMGIDYQLVQHRATISTRCCRSSCTTAWTCVLDRTQDGSGDNPPRAGGVSPLFWQQQGANSPRSPEKTGRLLARLAMDKQGADAPPLARDKQGGLRPPLAR